MNENAISSIGAAASTLIWRFGTAEFDESGWELRVGGVAVEMEPRPLAVLLQLLRSPGEVLTHEELLDAVYGHRHVGENVISNAIAKLRRALGDDERKVIVTVPRIGYRLAAKVSVETLSRVEAATVAAFAFEPGGDLPHRPNWTLVKPLGAGGHGGDAWLGEQAKTRERRVFKFGRDGAQLTGLKREITLFRVLNDALGPRDDYARILDWNLQEPPYFIELEWIPEGNLQEWADRRGGIGTIALSVRVELAAQIADALAAAHSVGVLHKDLKPSNVLVHLDETGQPRIKLSDFGSGRVLDAASLEQFGITRLGFTQTMAQSDATSGTPLYLAPELIAGQPPTVQADIYALGVMLYQMSVGDLKRPLSSGWEHDVADELLREDIVAAAAGDPKRRLADAAQLAQRLRGLEPRRAERERERQLQMEAEQARRSLERTRARRGLMLALAATLVLGSALSLWLAVSAQHARRDAEDQAAQAIHESQRAVRMQTFLYRLFKMANPEYTGKPIATVPDFLRMGMSKLPDYIHDAADLRQLQLGLGESMYESGDYADARTAFDRVMASATRDGAMADQAEAETLAGQIEIDHGNTAVGRRLEAEALALARAKDIPPRVRVLSEVYFAYNEDNNGFRTDENLRLLRAAVQEARDAHLAPDDTELALFSLADVLQMRGQSVEAKPIFEQLLPLYENDPLALCNRSEVYGWLASIANTNSDIAGSLRQYQKAYEGYVACSGPDSRGALNELPYLADALVQSGRAAEAVSMLEKALPTWRRVVGGNPDYSDMLYYLARGYMATARYADAERVANELIALITGKLAPDSRPIGLAHLVLGQALASQQRYREALPHAKIALALLDKGAASPYVGRAGTEAIALAQQVKMPTN